MFSLIPLCGCDEVPLHWFSAPQTVTADGQVHLACGGIIRIYSPSRDIKASSSSKSYEVVFNDEYGQSQDLTDLTSYTISDAQKDAHYAMPYVATPDNLSRTFSNGTPLPREVRCGLVTREMRVERYGMDLANGAPFLVTE